jgi:uncharacterized repeat protein (TIGR01451 family)
MFQTVNATSLLARLTLLTLIVVAGLWMGSWILSIPTSNASEALPRLTFASPIPPVGNPQLHVAKTVDNDSPEPGEIIEYTLTYLATSTTGHPNPRAYNARLYDFLPAGTQFLFSIPASDYENGRLLFTDNMVGQTEESVRVRVRVLEGYEQLYNHALLMADGVTPTHDSLLTAVEPPPTPWLNLSKTTDPVVLVNSDLVYTIHCQNPSGTTANGVTVIDVLPAGLSFEDASSPPDTTATLPLLTWSLGDLGPSESRTIIITTTAPASAGVITNVAMADGRQQVMTHTLFATQVVSGGAILRLNKFGSAAEVDVGEELVYTLRYENIGDQTATGTMLTDTLPADVAVTGIYSSTPLVSSQPLVWDIGQVFTDAPPEEVVITVTVEGDPDRMLHNVADIAAPGSFAGHAELNTRVRLAMMYLPVIMREI